MFITLDAFNEGLSRDLNESNEAPGILGADKIIKAEMGRSEDISTRSQVIPIKGENEYDLEADIMAANNKGTPSFIYLNSNRRATYIHIDAYGRVSMGSPVVFFNDVVDEEAGEGEGQIEADFNRKRSRPQFRNSSLDRVVKRLDYSRGYAGIIVLAVE